MERPTASGPSLFDKAISVWNESPLASILFIAFLVRLLAVIFSRENKNIDERISNFESKVCKLEKVAYFEPGIYDSFIHWLNPVNRNETCTIYKLILSQPDETL